MLPAADTSLAVIAAEPMPQQQRRAFDAQWYRPYFHFTPPSGWMNDPNGLVYHQGVWHHFYQSSPLREDGSAMAFHTRGWGHAVSTDLVHWRHLPLAIHPSPNYGGAWSGSGMVDHHNVLGLQTPGGPTVICLFFTGAGASAQYLATSSDGGRNWALHPDNPVVPTLPQDPEVRGASDRDPKVFYHAPSQGYVMVLFYHKHDPSGFQFLRSENLLDWELTDFEPGYFECPDFFELPVEGRPGESRWVLVNGNGNYQLGSFDGYDFTAELPRQQRIGSGHFSATQTWQDAPGGRRVQTAWLRWKGTLDERFPGMPFNQMQTVPCDLTLREVNGAVRLFRYPIPELEDLRGEELLMIDNRRITTDGTVELARLPGDHFDLLITVDPAAGDGRLHLAFQGTEAAITITQGRTQVATAGRSLSTGGNGPVRIRMLIDRNVVETYLNDGASSNSVGFLSPPESCGLAITASGNVGIKSLQVYPMHAYWQSDY